MKDWLRRLRGAIGIGALGALSFHLIGWLIIGVEALATGSWPTLTLIGRMSMFTIPVGGFVGLLTAGAIALGAGSSRLITKGRAFLLGLPLGAVGGLALSLTVGGLPLSALVANAITFALGTGALGAGAVALAERGDGKRLSASEAPAELPGEV